MKESYIEKKCVKLAKDKGFTSRKIKFIGQNGAPDRIFFKKNILIWVEFKTKNGIISELQKYQQSLLIEANQKVVNIFSIEDFKEII